MTRADLMVSLDRAGLGGGHWRLPDAAYDGFSPAFVAQAWGDWVRSLPPALRISRDVGGGKIVDFPRWLAEVFDCDDIAAQFGSFLVLCAANDAATRNVARGAAAAGTFDFWREADPKLGHCRNWFIDHGGAAHTFDAGDATFDRETAAERSTISEGEAA